MYGGKGGGLASGATTVTGAVVLPNTGDNHLLMVASIASIVAGAVVLVSSMARLAAKRAYRA